MLFAKILKCYLQQALLASKESLSHALVCLPLYIYIVVFFQVHGDMVSHMQVVATPSSTVNNIKYLDPYHRNHMGLSCLFLRQ